LKSLKQIRSLTLLDVVKVFELELRVYGGDVAVLVERSPLLQALGHN